MLDQVYAWLEAHPFLLAGLSAAAAWLLRHKGVGASLLPMLAGKSSKQPPALSVAAATSEHPAITVMQAGLKTGTANDVLPAVQKLIAKSSE